MKHTENLAFKELGVIYNNNGTPHNSIMLFYKHHRNFLISNSIPIVNNSTIMKIIPWIIISMLSTPFHCKANNFGYFMIKILQI